MNPALASRPAVWWAAETVTTVGYGDRLPVTAEGRLVGGLLMVVGIAVFAGSIAAALAGRLIQASAEDASDAADSSRIRELEGHGRQTVDRARKRERG